MLVAVGTGREGGGGAVRPAELLSLHDENNLIGLVYGVGSRVDCVLS